MKKKIGRKRMAAFFCLFAMIVSVLQTAMPPAYAAAATALVKKSGSAVIGGGLTVKLKNVPKGAKITYKSDKPSVASVSKKGKVTGKKAGTAKIAITMKKGKKKQKFTYRMTVKKPAFSKKVFSVQIGRKISLAIKNRPAKAAKAKYIWSSVNPKIARVSNGKAAGIRAGVTDARVKIASGKKFSYTLRCKIKVTKKQTPADSSTENRKPDTDTSTQNEAPATDASTEGKNPSDDTSGNPAPAPDPKPQDADEFARAGAELIKENGHPSVTSIAEDGEFASKRLIVRGKNNQLDFSSFGPKAVIKSSDGLYLIQFATVAAAKAAFSEICNWPDVEWAEADQYTLVDAESTPSYSSDSFKSWGVQKIGADRYAASISSVQGSISVAVVDTGVSNHTFLAGRILNGGYDFVDNDKDPSDKHYHGTHVAGTVVDCTPGLHVNILPVRVLDANGRGSTFNVGNGIQYAADHGAKVINLSLGGGHSSYIDEKVAYALGKGVSVVVAAGNERSKTDYACPAHIKDAVVVAAVDEYDRRASFSNYGDSVDVAAPGVRIISCAPGGSFKILDGTSMATPHAAAVVAMFRLVNPSLSPAQAEAMLKENTRDLGDNGWDPYYGSGVIDIHYAGKVLPTEIALNKNEITLEEGKQETLTATIKPDDAVDKTVTWESSNPSVASVANGIVMGLKAGTATITAKTINGKTKTCAVTVKKAVVVPSGITLDRDSMTIEAGADATLMAFVAPDNATDKTVTWNSSNPSVASVTDGTVTGISEGTATITAKTMNEKAASCVVTVKKAVIAPIRITLDKSEVILEEGMHESLMATVSPDDATDKTVAWSSDRPSVASVAGGVVAGVSAGTATITAKTVNGMTATCTVTVNKAVIAPAGVTLNKSQAALEIGERVRLTATVKPDNATDKTVTWSSSDLSVASVADGAVTGMKAGTAVITATTINGRAASCSITVKELAIENPVHHCTKENAELDKTDWSYIYFGSYPQTEVKGSALTEDIIKADYDKNGDAWVDGEKYRRIRWEDTNGLSVNFEFRKEYQYFRWEPVRWKVLQKEGSELFLMADKGLDCKCYNDEQADAAWESCTLRSWLNNVFYHTAFTAAEQRAVVKQKVVNTKNEEYGTDGGNDTEDKVYLLSCQEAVDPNYGFCSERYLLSPSRQVFFSDYAYVMGVSIGTDTKTEEKAWWWLRSPGKQTSHALDVHNKGFILPEGTWVDFRYEMVVPVLHLDLSAAR